jgi:hypothetical protein
MIEIKEPNVVMERLRRQHLLEPVRNNDEYLSLFRLMQPVSPAWFSRPGNPPELETRTSFKDSILTNKLRRDRIIVKARFLSGNVGYVFADQLRIYAAAFLHPLTRMNMIQNIVFGTVQRAGPITAAQIKEETGLLSKEIGPALQRLQRAFLVYEDQIDDDWDRAWYDFPSEWPDVDVQNIDPIEALVSVLRAFLQVHVFATIRQIADWSGLPLKKVEAASNQLADEKEVKCVCVESLGEGLVHGNVPDIGTPEKFKKVIALGKSDMLVRSHATELKQRFAGREVLQYLLIDGRLLGAVVGHWRIGPHDVDDIDIQLPKNQADERMDEILNAVASRYHPPFSQIRKYMGKPVAGLPQGE